MQRPATTLRQRFDAWRLRPRRLFGLRLLLTLIVLNVSVIAVTVWMSQLSRENYLATAEVESQNYAKLLEQDIGTLVHNLDLMLLSTARSYPVLMVRDDTLAARLVALQATQYPDVELLMVLDASGRVLRTFACDEAQGYHFARPMEPGAFAEFLTRQVQLPQGVVKMEES